MWKEVKSDEEEEAGGGGERNKKPVSGRAIKANSSAMAIKAMTRLNTHNQISKPK